MDQSSVLTQGFEANRPHLRAVAYRMLGNVPDAEDAVQEAWLRLSTSDSGSIDNLGGWLTTVVSRICLNVLRSRTRAGASLQDSTTAIDEHVARTSVSPEEQAVLADSLGWLYSSSLSNSPPPSGSASFFTTCSRSRSTRSP